jgi:hypothetical protein
LKLLKRRTLHRNVFAHSLAACRSLKKTSEARGIFQTFR